MTTDVLLRIENLRAVAGRAGANKKPIVDDVSLVLRRGDMLGLIGESGAGKSTLGLAALGYARPGCVFTGGRVLFLGEDLLRLGLSELNAMRGSRVAYVPQSAAAAFNPAYTLIHQVVEGPVRHGLMSPQEARNRAIALFAELNLPDPENFGNRFPHQVSGGQLQRAATAMAMVCQPDLLVLDEPTTALDVTTQVEVLASLRRTIARHGMAGLYISHDLSVVAQMASRIMVLRHGKMVEEGPTADILANPREEYTRQLLATREASGVDRVADGTPLLAVRGIKARYGGGDLVVDDINLQVQRGQTVAVVGESGSGKSSLARVICGVLPAAGGTLSVDGADLPLDNRNRSREQRRRIQMVTQSPDTALNPHQSVLEIIGRPVSLYFGLSRKDVRAEVIRLLEQVELDPAFVDRKPTELSGGQKQRVSIARALAAKPDLVICDEATSALDPLVADGVLDLLGRLQRESGIAYLFITHDINVVRRIASGIVVMQRGRIVDQGNRANVLDGAVHPYTRKLLDAVPELRPGWLDEHLNREHVTLESAP